MAIFNRNVGLTEGKDDGNIYQPPAWGDILSFPALIAEPAFGVPRRCSTPLVSGDRALPHDDKDGKVLKQMVSCSRRVGISLDFTGVIWIYIYTYMYIYRI